MEKILVGDVGATSADWVLIAGGEPTYFQTVGFNPTAQRNQRLQQMIGEVARHLVPNQVTCIYYYGAGCGDAPVEQLIKKSFATLITYREMIVESDLLAAARALCKHDEGIVAILGTGSNICHYDGQYIDVQGATLGFPLGDEGSGSDIGARLVRAFYYNHLPEEVDALLATFLPRDRFDFLQSFKASGAPNQLLASYIGRLGEGKDHPFVRQIVRQAFTNFVEQHVCNFRPSSDINFAGSVAFYFCDELKTVLSKSSYRLGKVTRKPIEDLASYHLDEI